MRVSSKPPRDDDPKACSHVAVRCGCGVQSGRCFSSEAASGTTTIDGRTFDFIVPTKLHPSQKVLDAFMGGAINTPSPPPEIWKPYNHFLFNDQARAYLQHYLKHRPPASKKEVQALMQHTKDNMIFVTGGTFMMGDYGWLTKAHRPITDSKLDDPPHKVTLDSYSLMKNRVTYAQYDVYTRIKRLPPAGIKYVFLGSRFPNFPAFVTWQRARDYCLWMGRQARRPFDLPTEAQYEYAARSGGKWLYLASTFEKKGELLPNIHKFAALMRKADKGVTPNDALGVPVGTYGHNYLGFEDMIGPTFEWVFDWYAPYPDHPQVNPRGPKSGAKKTARKADYDYQGTINRERLLPNKPEAGFHCAINATTP
jgi:formylglycine-generating enzyme required for sulfatase activity